MAERLHQHVLPDKGQDPSKWTLAEWHGVMNECHYQAQNQGEPLFMTAHNGIRWLVDYFLAERFSLADEETA